MARSPPSQSQYRKWEPLLYLRKIFFQSPGENLKERTYTPFRCVRKNPEGALRSISDTRAPLCGFCRSHSVTEPPQRLGFSGLAERTS